MIDMLFTSESNIDALNCSWWPDIVALLFRFESLWFASLSYLGVFDLIKFLRFNVKVT